MCFIQCVRKVAVHLQKVLEVITTSVETGLNLFNFIRKYFVHICVRKVAVHLQKMLEVITTSVDTGVNLFNSQTLCADLRWIINLAVTKETARL
jgi:hypothetical protein